MATYVFSDNAVSSLASGVSGGATSLTLATGEGAKFPTPAGGTVFTLRLGTDASNEVVIVSARSTDALTCSATANAWPGGTQAILTFPAVVATNFVQRPEIAPPGTDKQLTYNDGGAAAGSGVEWDKSTKTATLRYDATNSADVAVSSAGALTLTPKAGANLNIATSGAGDLAVNTNQLYVDSSTGYVGIGTETPGYRMQLKDTTNGCTIDSYGKQATFFQNLRLQASSSGGIGPSISLKGVNSGAQSIWFAFTTGGTESIVYDFTSTGDLHLGTNNGVANGSLQINKKTANNNSVCLILMNPTTSVSSTSIDHNAWNATTVGRLKFVRTTAGQYYGSIILSNYDSTRGLVDVFKISSGSVSSFTNTLDAQITANYDTANYCSLTATSTGKTSLTTTGTAPALILDNRIYINKNSKTLTESTETGILEVSVTTGQQISGRIQYHIEAGDGTDFQTLKGNVEFAANNKAATVTSAFVNNETVNLCTTGTLTNTTTITNGTGKITINLNAVSSLTQTYLRCYWSAYDIITGIVTPL
jgi:hypothetical protein